MTVQFEDIQVGDRVFLNKRWLPVTAHNGDHIILHHSRRLEYNPDVTRFAIRRGVLGSDA